MNDILVYTTSDRFRNDILDMLRLFYEADIAFEIRGEKEAAVQDGIKPEHDAAVSERAVDLLTVVEYFEAESWAKVPKAKPERLMIESVAECGAMEPGAKPESIMEGEAAEPDAMVPGAKSNSLLETETESHIKICFRFCDKIGVFAAEQEQGSVRAPQLVEECAELCCPKEKAKYHLKMALYRILKRRTGKELPWGALVGIRPVKIVRKMLEEDGMAETQVVTALKNQYDVSEHKVKLCLEIAAREKPVLQRSSRNDTALYIGIPFCRTRCAYCSFPSDAFHKAEVYGGAYLKALKQELSFLLSYVWAEKLHIKAVYLGGGTPTALLADDFAELMSWLSENLPGEHLTELTIEAGRPDTMEEEKLACMREAFPQDKLLRLCINPQTMNDQTLERIGRKHTAQDVVRVFEQARATGFQNINMDVIAGLPEENAAMFSHTMEMLKNLNPESFTIHTLAVKRSSAINEFRSRYTFAEADEIAAMLDQANQTAAALDMKPYYLYRQKNMVGNLENTGYAKAGFSCVYNIHEMADRIDILAAGAGAATKLVNIASGRIERVFNAKNLVEYIDRVDEMIERKKKLLWMMRMPE